MNPCGPLVLGDPFPEGFNLRSLNLETVAWKRVLISLK